jgi:hypothetical protein
MQVTRHDSRRVTPFGHPGITARLTAPPGLSRPPTSFIGSWYQGIHRPPLPTYPITHKPPHTKTYQQTTNTKMLASTMQISTHHQPTTRPPATSDQPSHAWHQDNNPTPPRGSTTHHKRGSTTHHKRGSTTRQGRGTVVLSEPQQGAHRRTRPDRPALSAPPTPRTPTRGHDGCARPYSTDPASTGIRLTSVSAHELPRPTEGGRGLLSPPPTGRDGRSLERR